MLATPRGSLDLRDCLQAIDGGFSCRYDVDDCDVGVTGDRYGDLYEPYEELPHSRAHLCKQGNKQNWHVHISFCDDKFGCMTKSLQHPDTWRSVT